MITNKYEPQQKHRLRTVSKIYWDLKPFLRDPNLALGFCYGSKHTVVRSAWRFSNSSMDHHSVCIKLLNRILKLKPTAQVFITDLIGVHSPNLEVVQPLLRLKLVGIVAFVSMKENVFSCKDIVEDDTHVLLYCPQYTSLRNELSNEAEHVLNGFDNLNGTEKVAFILSNPFIANLSAETCHLWNLLYSSLCKYCSSYVLLNNDNFQYLTTF